MMTLRVGNNLWMEGTEQMKKPMRMFFLLAGILSLVLGTVVPAFADDQQQSGSIEIHIDGKVYKDGAQALAENKDFQGTCVDAVGFGGKAVRNCTSQGTVETNRKETAKTGSIAAGDTPDEVLARIKKNVSDQWPGQYSLQKTLVDAHIKSWEKLQRNYTDIPDTVFFEIRNRKAREWPDQYSLQETLVDADVKAWKELNQ